MVNDPREERSPRERPRWVMASLNIWQMMFIIDGPLAMILSYAFLLLTSLAWRDGRAWAGILWVLNLNFSAVSVRYRARLKWAAVVYDC
eukprot:1103271-Amorphochlora_amoeboformis.AAC.1